MNDKQTTVAAMVAAWGFELDAKIVATISSVGVALIGYFAKDAQG